MPERSKKRPLEKTRIIRVIVSTGILVAFMIYIGVDTGRVLPFVLAGGLVVFAAGMMVMMVRHPDA